ncbi:MAG: metallophosphoesterase [Cyanobacteria bacterium P01_D01_bin.1]
MPARNLALTSAKEIDPLQLDSAQPMPVQPQPVQPQLLTDPFLQLPTDSSVQVVWFTEFEGIQHFVEYGDGNKSAAATRLLSRTYEDSASQLEGQTYTELTRRPVWRHEATVSNLVPGEKVPYRVTSIPTSGQAIRSDFFTLSPTPTVGTPSKVLLTSDHQLKQMVPANLQKVEETAGRVDGIFFAGDLVNVPDRASEWFDGAKGLAFFPGLQGRAQYALTKGETTTVYKGGEIIQHAPLFPTIGNHEVMGRVSETEPLNQQYKHTLPRQLVRQFYPPPKDVEQDDWLEDHSHNTRTYEEIFSLPTAQLPNGTETQTYYATTFGDVRLVSLYATRIWRSPGLRPDIKGSYREKATDLETPPDWGYGQHIFEDISKGSAQYEWLQQELASEAFQSAKYKIVMMHHPPHTLGSNIVPAFTNPVMVKNFAKDGSLRSVQYEYPMEEDYITRDLAPLLEQAGVQLVFYGHSHLWNRFVGRTGMHFLETSNVGNSYGAHLEGNPRPVPRDSAVEKAGDLIPFQSNYAALNDPNGLMPVVPNIAPLKGDDGEPLPYIASNDITSFTLFDTGDGTISSYYFDTRQPDSDVVKFDQFTIGHSIGQ